MVAGLPRGSGIVFTFAPEKEKNRTPEATESIAARAAETAEPWLARFSAEDLKKQLHAFGFTEVQFLEPAEAASRYYHHRRDLPGPKMARPCRATI
jgi:O-methyltransferase involved in polyketide biosynthesis